MKLERLKELAGIVKEAKELTEALKGSQKDVFVNEALKQLDRDIAHTIKKIAEELDTDLAEAIGTVEVHLENLTIGDLV